jgi:hypothetical protein
MAKKKKKRILVYRDTLTGRFVSKAKWKRSRSRGGKRFRRSAAGVKKRRVIRKRARGTLRGKRPRPARPTGRIIDWLVLFEYNGKPGNRFQADVLVPELSSKSEDEIITIAANWLAAKFNRTIDWSKTDVTAAKGPTSTEKSIRLGIRLREAVRHPR